MSKKLVMHTLGARQVVYKFLKENRIGMEITFTSLYFRIKYSCFTEDTCSD